MTLWALYTALTMPGRPAWKKVESPRKQTTLRVSLKIERPDAVDVEWPMDRRTLPML